MKTFKIGYTQGVFDMFHIGHLNLLKEAKKQCDYLIVGVNSDSLVNRYKSKVPIIPQNDRKQIVESIKWVDQCIIVDTLDKIAIWNQLHFDAIFIGDDWKGNERWRQTELDLSTVGAKVIYLEYTEGISSSILRTKIAK